MRKGLMSKTNQAHPLRRQSPFVFSAAGIGGRGRQHAKQGEPSVGSDLTYLPYTWIKNNPPGSTWSSSSCSASNWG